MEDFDEDQGLAPKVFFVAPDPSVVTETFLETAFLLGYEVYTLAEDLGGNLRDRVEVLFDTYDELLLFFSVDRKGTRDDWVEYLGDLQQRHGARARIGVLYHRTSSELQDQLTNQKFLLEAGLQAGSIALHHSSRRNYQLLFDVLEANQAGGRRKRIRMRCHAPFGVNFSREGGFLDAALVDLSVSHFSALFGEVDPDWELGTKLSKVQLRLGGHLLMVNALVGLKRMVEGRAVYVFLFHPETERPGLDDLVKARVNTIIFQHFRARTTAFLEDRFRMKV